MIDGFLYSVYKDQVQFLWCHEHAHSPTLHPKLPTSAHPEAEAAFLIIATRHLPPPPLPCLRKMTTPPLLVWILQLRLVRVGLQQLGHACHWSGGPRWPGCKWSCRAGLFAVARAAPMHLTTPLLWWQWQLSCVVWQGAAHEISCRWSAPRELPVVAAAAVAAVPQSPAAAASALIEVVQQRQNESAIMMCSIAIAMIVGGSNGYDSKRFTQWDSTIMVQLWWATVATAQWTVRWRRDWDGRWWWQWGVTQQSARPNERVAQWEATCQPANAMRGSGSTMGTRTTRQGKWEGGAMRVKVTMSWRVERRWQQQGDATSSWGKLEGSALRGNVITSWRNERWWHDEKWCKDNQSYVQRWEKVKLVPSSILKLDQFLLTQAPLT